MVLKGIKESERIDKMVENMAYFSLGGTLVIGAFLFLEKLLGFGFDLSVSLGL